MLKVLIVEDKLFLSKALEEKLSLFEEIEVKSVVQNGQGAIDYLAKNHTIDLIFMDIEMPIMNGIEATQKIKDTFPQIKILILTVFDNNENIFNAIKAGANGYLLKDTKANKIKESVDDIMLGNAAMSPSIALKVMHLLNNPLNNNQETNTDSFDLSKREVEVLTQVSKGLQNKEIADNLFVSLSTIKKHIENIYSKLHVHNRIEAIQLAKRNHFL